MAKHNQTGRKGEELARMYMENQAYEILETNWRYRHYEIDLIAEIENYLVFVEVKTRKYKCFGEPEIFVDRQKQQRTILAANAYIQSKQINKEARFDIISIYMQNDIPQIKHIPGAYYPRIK